MNVFFHSLSAIGIAVLIIDTHEPCSRTVLLCKAALAFICGVVMHGFLDYMPHRYPINAKVDVVVSLLLMVILMLKAKPKYSVILTASFLGSIFPDIVDLSSSIFNKYLHLNVPVFAKVFPWHWPLYSGSIYEGGYGVSLLNHGMVLMLFTCIIAVRWRQIKNIFR